MEINNINSKREIKLEILLKTLFMVVSSLDDGITTSKPVFNQIPSDWAGKLEIFDGGDFIKVWVPQKKRKRGVIVPNRSLRFLN